ncbi:MAG: hypothetical protein WC460_03430 [Patescibacteria group bacterium]
MRRTKQLTHEQLRKLIFAPMSKEEVQWLREIREADRGLLASNLEQMEREKNEPDDEKED